MSGFAVLGFVFTLGAGRDWSASALEEGCVHKWLIEAMIYGRRRHHTPNVVCSTRCGSER
jgi:hypothetical protein